MKKFFSFLITLSLIFQPIGFSAWDDTDPAGKESPSDLDTLITTNNAALEALLSGMRGWSNLNATTSGSSTTVTVTADVLFLQAENSIASRETSISESISITTSGASGLVTALTEANSTWYYVWIAKKSSDGTVNGYLSTTTSLSTFLTQVDSGYDSGAIVSAVFNDSSGNFIDFDQVGDEYWYSTWRTVSSGAPDNSSWTSLDMSNYVPGAISNIARILLENNASDGVLATNDNSVSSDHTVGDIPNRLMVLNADIGQILMEINMITADTLYWATNDSTGTSYFKCAGFKINKLI